ncbi:MAG: DUF3160 domain-containing protein [Lachnospiraceae bacterium]|nr:DUF3160 domain-containing protein [Lachnospiraceae bacterium]
MNYKRIAAIIVASAISFTSLGCQAAPAGVYENAQNTKESEEASDEEVASDNEEAGDEDIKEGSETRVIESPESLDRNSLVAKYMEADIEETEATTEPYEVDDDLGNVYNLDLFYLDDEQKERLKEDYFYISSYGGREFFDSYEYNRYGYVPSFVTVDSLLHTYHLYFSYLLRNTEKNYLYEELNELTASMLKESKAQYEELKGSKWEKAAKVNLGFFNVAACLLDDSAEIDEDLKDEVGKELELIEAASGIADSPLFDHEEDYSQFIPRGYYDDDENLRRYFKTMMWYGRMNFTREDPDGNTDLDRSALLMTLAMKDEVLESWEKIYSVTTFFAGAADDSGYYEYKPIIDAVYGEDVNASGLMADDSLFDEFHTLTGELKKPKINSVVVYQDDSAEDKESKSTGFRFMGQRFSIDTAVFSKLVFSAVDENSDGDKRMLPDALDVPAAFGSETALSILDDMGATDYEGYTENMDKLRAEIEDADETLWNASLYSEWLNMLRPVIEEKGEGYPSFMLSDKWKIKDLITFLGSYAELKHDTILYSKQLMAEMGGGDIEEYDDRGYVEPEVRVYSRLHNLVVATKEGLSDFGYLTKDNEEDLDILADLSAKLRDISIKELKDEVLTDEEYELIRCYGGEIEHFWVVANRDQAGTDMFSSEEYPAAIIADVATDPNGSVLEVGTGDPRDIYVLIKVDGKIKIARGAVYTFYEFPWPMENRLTDHEWREMLGIEFEDYTQWHESEVDLPEWTEGLYYEPEY